MAKGKLAFEAGDQVAWHHSFATQHAAGSIARLSAVPQLSEEHEDFGGPGTGQFGTIVEPANELGTRWLVNLGDEDHPDERVLTHEEIVKVADE